MPTSNLITPRWIIRTEMGNYFGLESLETTADNGFEAIRTDSLNEGVYPPPMTVVFNCPYILESYTGRPVLVNFPNRKMVMTVSPVFTLPVWEDALNN